MNKSEPPSWRPCPNYSQFFVGKNSRGNWVAQDQTGLCGGLFIGRAEAIRFALFETGNRPEAIVFVPSAFELDLSAPRRSRAEPETVVLQRAA